MLDCLLLLDKADIPDDLGDLPQRIVLVSPVVMKKLPGLQSIESIEAIALMKIPSTFCNLDEKWQDADCHGWFPSQRRILVLDGIQGGVFLLPGCYDPFNDKALRASRGASFQLPIVSGTWTHLEALTNKFHLKILVGHPESSNFKASILAFSRAYRFAIVLGLG